MEISAKIATVLNDQMMAVNVGSDEGVDEGDSVILWETVTVTDPDTHEPLGDVRLKKLSMMVVSVQPKLAVATVPFDQVPLNRVMFGVRSKPLISLVTNIFDEGSRAVFVEPGMTVSVMVQKYPD